MKKTNIGDSVDFGFENPVPGEHTCMIEEGMKEYTRDDGTVSLQIPFRVLDGQSEGAKFSIFAPISSSDNKAMLVGEKYLSAIIQLTGMMPVFEKQFPGDVAVTHKSVVEAIKIKLPGRMIGVETKNVAGKDGKEYVQVKKLYAVKKGAGAASTGSDSSDSSTEDAW